MFYFSCFHVEKMNRDINVIRAMEIIALLLLTCSPLFALVVVPPIFVIDLYSVENLMVLVS